jgi:hypothetical protein
MMRQLWFLVWGAIAGAGLMWGAMNYHFIRRDGGIAMVPKYPAQLSGTYIDIRDWGITEWTEHPDLMIALKRHDRLELLGETNVVEKSLNEATELFQ